jgi:hypothetical protein
MYLVSFRRYRRLLIEAEGGLRARRNPKSWPTFGIGPRKAAVIGFMAKTVLRSRMHRTVLMAYAGAALAILVNSSVGAFAVAKHAGWREGLQFAALFWPVAGCMILLRGFRHVCSMPAELRSNWLFQLTESQGREEWMSGVEWFVIGGAIVPVQLAMGAVGFAVLPWGVAARMIVLQLLVSLSAFEILFYSWQQLPFTCSYTPGRKPLATVLAGYIAMLGLLVPVLAIVIKGVAGMWELFLVYGAAFAGFWIWMRVRRRDGWGQGKMLYEELPEALPNLGLRG